MRAWVGVAAVIVRVYDLVGMPEPDRRAALDVAFESLQAANVHVIFKNCRSGGAESCDTVPAPGERIVRIINSPKPASKHTGAVALGNAVIDPVTNTGVFATIYYDRIARRATGEIDQRLLLGRTIAHELGHLLIGVTAHSNSGLMREVWTDEELRLNQSLDWAFSGEDRWRLCAKMLGKRSLCDQVGIRPVNVAPADKTGSAPWTRSDPR